jgi:hypothetical protein
MNLRSDLSSEDERLDKAARVAVAREERLESPRGEWRDRLWYPAPEERRGCCEHITPTEANRQALDESHCRTQAHVAHLFDVSLSNLRHAVKRARQAAGTAARTGRPLLSPGGLAEALCEASRAAWGEARETLRAEGKCLLEILPRLLAALEAEIDLEEILDQTSASVDRLRLTLDFCRQVEATVVGARTVHELTSRLLEKGAKSG